MKELPREAFEQANVDMHTKASKALLDATKARIAADRKVNDISLSLHDIDEKKHKAQALALANEERDAQRTYDKKVADARDHAQNLLGFVDTDTDVVYLPNDASKSTIAHETMHIYQNDQFVDKSGNEFQEAATEYLTRDLGYGPDPGVVLTPKYEAGSAQIARDLKKLGGPNALDEAYFKGNLEPMKQAYKANHAKGDPATLTDYFKAFSKKY